MGKLVTVVFLFIMGCETIGDPSLTLEEYLDTACSIQPVDPSDISTWEDLNTIASARHAALTGIDPPNELQDYHDARIVQLQLILDFVEEQEQGEAANLISLIIITANPLSKLQETEFQKLSSGLQKQLIDAGCQSEDDSNSLTPETSQDTNPASLRSTPTVEPPLSEGNLGDTLAINAERLTSLYGEPELRGEIILTFESAVEYTNYEDNVCGSGEMTAQGVYLAVYYSVENEANTRIQPATQINNSFVLMDDRARQWKEGGSGDECFLEANLADLVGAVGPEHWIGPGFTGKTVIVFDIPQAATGLHLVSKKLGVIIAWEK